MKDLVRRALPITFEKLPRRRRLIVSNGLF